MNPGKVEGTDLQIVVYPDPRLRAANTEFGPEDFGPELQKLAKDMFKVSRSARGWARQLHEPEGLGLYASFASMRRVKTSPLSTKIAVVPHMVVTRCWVKCFR